MIMNKENSSDCLNIKPTLSRYVILRYAEPDPPLIYNRKTHQLIKAKSYKVLDILSLCNGNNNIMKISELMNVDHKTICSLLKKLKNLRWLSFE